MGTPRTGWGRGMPSIGRVAPVCLCRCCIRPSGSSDGENSEPRRRLGPPEATTTSRCGTSRAGPSTPPPRATAASAEPTSRTPPTSPPVVRWAAGCPGRFVGRLGVVGRRGPLVVVGGGGSRVVGGSAGKVKTAVEGSPLRLGTGHVDLYCQHRVDPNTPIEETIGALAELVTGTPLRQGPDHRCQA
ncbi:aldo/keto reductase [Streptomyces lacrimifluminis]|uniref:aldo/keto reductase n=1 Tax=Streptomyces lacrimifluminis TaxID=1500077 RepID=UPI0027E5738C|nr:aldo/keto reductase [Streptomyces lacrimifluminis]